MDELPGMDLGGLDVNEEDLKLFGDPNGATPAPAPAGKRKRLSTPEVVAGDRWTSENVPGLFALVRFSFRSV